MADAKPPKSGPFADVSEAQRALGAVSLSDLFHPDGRVRAAQDEPYPFIVCRSDK